MMHGITLSGGGCGQRYGRNRKVRFGLGRDRSRWEHVGARPWQCFGVPATSPGAFGVDVAATLDPLGDDVIAAPPGGGGALGVDVGAAPPGDGGGPPNLIILDEVVGAQRGGGQGGGGGGIINLDSDECE
uniref:Uncharacterized protein n=1 Tax=Tanacetum cinerariifolium TaxID=118510 RepID=A0A699K2V4_TANCI|nr:hypothetical protein [Tanacetum cinerariifolium]